MDNIKILKLLQSSNKDDIIIAANLLIDKDLEYIRINFPGDKVDTESLNGFNIETSYTGDLPDFRLDSYYCINSELFFYAYDGHIRFRGKKKAQDWEIINL